MPDPNEPIAIALVNYSPDTLSADDMRIYQKAITAQLVGDFAPLWPTLKMPEVFVLADDEELDEHPNWWPVYFHPGDAGFWAIGTAGWHKTMRHTFVTDNAGNDSLPLYPFTPAVFLPLDVRRPDSAMRNRPYSLVLTQYGVGFFPEKFANTELQNPTIARALSHEILEMIVNPYGVKATRCPPFLFDYGINYLTQTPTVDRAPYYALFGITECVDSVQFDKYLVNVEGIQVELSNFQSEAWFNWDYANFLYEEQFPAPAFPHFFTPIEPPKGTRWDFMGNCPGPWTVSREKDGFIYFVGAGSTALGEVVTMPDYKHPFWEGFLTGPAPTAPIAATTPGVGQARVAKETLTTNLDYVYVAVSNLPGAARNDRAATMKAKKDAADKIAETAALTPEELKTQEETKAAEFFASHGLTEAINRLKNG